MFLFIMFPCYVSIICTVLYKGTYGRFMGGNKLAFDKLDWLASTL